MFLDGGSWVMEGEPQGYVSRHHDVVFVVQSYEGGPSCGYVRIRPHASFWYVNA